MTQKRFRRFMNYPTREYAEYIAKDLKKRCKWFSEGKETLETKIRPEKVQVLIGKKLGYTVLIRKVKLKGRKKR